MTTSPLPRPGPNALRFSHIGFYVRDLERMVRFYTEVMCFIRTDQGDLGATQLVFLSRDPSEHHQLVLATGRPPESFALINQLSFRVPDLATLRLMRDLAAQAEAAELVSVTHGNAVSIYFRDPEGNRIEVFMDTPWYCEQPLREPVDLDQSDEAILVQAHAIAAGRPRFQPRAEWQDGVARRMGFTAE